MDMAGTVHRSSNIRIGEADRVRGRVTMGNRATEVMEEEGGGDDDE